MSAAATALAVHAQAEAAGGGEQAVAPLQAVLCLLRPQLQRPYHGAPSCGEGPDAAFAASIVLNALAETAADTGDDRGAVPLFEEAVRWWPCNVSATLSLAHLRREVGEVEAAAALLESVLVTPRPQRCDAAPGVWNWWGELAEEPHARCMSVAAYHLAHLLSRMGRHAEAVPLLQRLQFKHRIAPGVWRAAHAAHGAEGGGVGTAAASCGGVRLYGGAVPTAIAAALRSAFATGAPYWRENGYETREYFSWWHDLASPPSNAVEQLIAHIAPTVAVGGKPPTAAEWWVHTRGLAGDFGHQLHFDMDEGCLERTGKVLHPMVSTVIYLEGAKAGAAPTLVLDQTLESDLADRGWLVRCVPSAAQGGGAAHTLPSPRDGAMMCFPGNLLHGVLPSRPPRRPAAGRQEARRLTLMVGWWSEDDVARMPGRRPHGPG